MFTPFIKSLGINCTTRVRISDNVLEEEDWSVDEIVLRNNVVISQSPLCKGAYTIPNMMGWTVSKLIEWTQYDSTGSHPENYYEIDL